jgi:hypothetical protein
LVLAPESSRRRIARTLNAAYADGLLSDDTFAERLDQLLKDPLVYPRRLVGDLSLRPRGKRALARELVSAVIDRMLALVEPPDEEHVTLLALDWSGKREELLVGRHLSCDVVLSDPTVSRQHARLVFRAGCWVVQDLESKNGTLLNGSRIGRAELRPGDRLVLGCERLRVD